jgi:hypothetical protein
VRGEVLSYAEMCRRERAPRLRRGMNFGLGGDYSVLLTKRRDLPSPYGDSFLDGGDRVIYRGHDAPRRVEAWPSRTCSTSRRRRPPAAPTQNARFLAAAEGFRRGERPAERVRLYEKLEVGVWEDMGLFHLVAGGRSTTGGGPCSSSSCGRSSRAPRRARPARRRPTGGPRPDAAPARGVRRRGRAAAGVRRPAGGRKRRGGGGGRLRALFFERERSTRLVVWYDRRPDPCSRRSAAPPGPGPAPALARAVGAPVTAVGAADMGRLFRDHPDGWEAFYRTYRIAPGLVEVALTRRGDGVAEAFVGRACGEHCGHAWRVEVRRVGGRWQATRHHAGGGAGV